MKRSKGILLAGLLCVLLCGCQGNPYEPLADSSFCDEIAEIVYLDSRDAQYALSEEDDPVAFQDAVTFIAKLEGTPCDAPEENRGYRFKLYMKDGTVHTIRAMDNIVDSCVVLWDDEAYCVRDDYGPELSVHLKDKGRLLTDTEP